MSLLDEAVKGWGGFAVGVGAVVAAPRFLPSPGPLVRPLAKLVVRTALMVNESVRALVAEVSEQVGDLVAEVKAERNGASRPKRRAPAATTVSIDS